MLQNASKKLSKSVFFSLSFCEKPPFRQVVEYFEYFKKLPKSLINKSYQSFFCCPIFIGFQFLMYTFKKFFHLVFEFPLSFSFSAVLLFLSLFLIWVCFL